MEKSELKWLPLLYLKVVGCASIMSRVSSANFIVLFLTFGIVGMVFFALDITDCNVSVAKMKSDKESHCLSLTCDRNGYFVSIDGST
jgi:hypothetical protein